VLKLQQQTTNLNSLNTGLTTEANKLKDEMLSLRGQLSQQEKYILQLQSEKAEAYRWVEEYKKLLNQKQYVE